ncbi:RHS repeat-associated core domain-containing protein [Desulfatibacillum alkenivorans DSM 16219]|jgi:RHS repeat-associated protein|uniref:RHS repeat-associated core domain-containing protein n=1 Tax=Desulfatibacillum alkenivorans DSM 16219 TaxID=1121393 RepID=A0A1M6Y2T4_9BACT|nr:RHS repeat-associated core domain-containing protein [Desulfatibacillum alkenivorans]SHL12484.1 RHS repeat-associated core domain-containing protein [Desulfatibacillum alkenivorans DSM 16219]
MPVQVVKSVTGQPDVTTNFYYDGNGARVRKEVVGESTTFYAGSLYEVKNGVATKYIFGADRRIAKITDGEGVRYFSKDHLGSSTVVTDDSGAVVEQADYRPFGEDRFYTGSVATPTPYKYTDQELDTSTGLYNYDARHYDPAIGRFISPDSLIPNAYDPQQLNPYAYCSNNPLRYVDPTGHAVVDVTGAMIGVRTTGNIVGNHQNMSFQLSPTLFGGNISVYRDDHYGHIMGPLQPQDAIPFGVYVDYNELTWDNVKHGRLSSFFGGFFIGWDKGVNLVPDVDIRIAFEWLGEKLDCTKPDDDDIDQAKQGNSNLGVKKGQKKKSLGEEEGSVENSPETSSNKPDESNQASSDNSHEDKAGDSGEGNDDSGFLGGYSSSANSTDSDSFRGR